MSGVPDDDLSKFIDASRVSDAASSRAGYKPFKARLLPFDDETVVGGARPDVLVYSRGPRPWLKFSLQLATILVAGAVGWYSASGTGVSKEMAGKYATSDAVQALASRVAANDEAAHQREATRGKQTNELASIRKTIEALGRNVDGIRTAQQSQRTDTDRETARKELTQKIDRLAERLDRLEQQTSAKMPTASISRPTAAAPAQALAPPPPAKPAQAAQAPSSSAKPLRAPPPGGYVLGEVTSGGAVVHGHHGPVNVWPGSMLPGAGRVQAILRRNGQWVVTTTDGEIDSDAY
jgi:DNA-binding transcriptional MerR regulator